VSNRTIVRRALGGRLPRRGPGRRDVAADRTGARTAGVPGSSCASPSSSPVCRPCSCRWPSRWWPSTFSSAWPGWTSPAPSTTASMGRWTAHPRTPTSAPRCAPGL